MTHGGSMGSLYFYCLFQKEGKRKKFHGIAGTCNRVCRVFQYLIWLRVKSIIIFFFFILSMKPLVQYSRTTMLKGSTAVQLSLMRGQRKDQNWSFTWQQFLYDLILLSSTLSCQNISECMSLIK